MLVNTTARIGVFAIALGAYLPQFPSLVPEFAAQYADFKTRIPASVELIDGGIVTTKEKAMEAGDKFRAADMDLVILQLLTYATSYNMLPAVRDLNGYFKFVAAEGVNEEGPIFTFGDTNMRTRFTCGAREFCNRWSEAGPTHHMAAASGRWIDTILKVAKIFNVPVDVITR